MKVLVATDGSKYGRWAIEWAATLPLTVKPVLRVLHVVDVASLRAPFMIQPVMVGTERYIQQEVKRMEAAAKSAKTESRDLLSSLGVSGTVSLERGAVATTITKHASRGVGLLALGSRGLDALDRFMLGSISTHAIHHATCSVLIVKEASRPLTQIVLAMIALAICLTVVVQVVAMPLASVTVTKTTFVPSPARAANGTVALVVGVPAGT